MPNPEEIYASGKGVYLGVRYFPKEKGGLGGGGGGPVKEAQDWDRIWEVNKLINYTKKLLKVSFLHF